MHLSHGVSAGLYRQSNRSGPNSGELCDSDLQTANKWVRYWVACRWEEVKIIPADSDEHYGGFVAWSVREVLDTQLPASLLHRRWQQTIRLCCLWLRMVLRLLGLPLSFVANVWGVLGPGAVESIVGGDAVDLEFGDQVVSQVQERCGEERRLPSYDVHVRPPVLLLVRPRLQRPRLDVWMRLGPLSHIHY